MIARMRLRSSMFAVALLAALPLGSCATIAGTAVSPITGGVDLCRRALRGDQWMWTPFVFVGGAVAGPFVAIYNGLGKDADLFCGWREYWNTFGEVFRPFQMIRTRQ